MSKYIDQSRIKSFVLREGRMTPSQRNGLTSGWPLYGLAVENGVCEYDKIFGNKAEVILEIGFGMGHSLLQMAKENPEKNFIGIEVHKPGVGSLLAGIAKAQITNIKIYCCDAVEVLEKAIPPSSLEKVVVFFPDPWHKKRHHKRRLIQAPFVNLLISRLKSGGLIHLATDWQDYADQMLAILSENPQLINLAGHGNFMPQPTERPTTKFEKRGEKLGHGVWDLLFAKEK